MRNYIMVYDNGIKVFELKNNKFRELLHHESEKILRSFNDVEFIKEKDDETLELVTGLKTDYSRRLIVSGAKLFNCKDDPLYDYVENLGLVIDRYMERKREIEIRDILITNNSKVNRKKKNNAINKQIVTMGLLASISLGLMSLKSYKAKNIEPTEQIDNTPSFSMEVTNASKVAYYPFDDLTENGKLERTINECAYYLDIYIDRYGLPRDLTYALTTQESGVADYRVYSNGGCGPMQIQVDVQNGEYYEVPIYKDGKLTGEYDKFYAVDIKDKDNPKWQNKNIKIIQSEDNFQIGCAYFRRCIDKYKNIFIALDAYNKGINALSTAGEEIEIEYFKNDFTNFEWRELIKNKYGENYGDKDYNDNVLRYLVTDVDGKARIEYYYRGEKIIIDLYNTRLYNNEIMRG